MWQPLQEDALDLGEGCSLHALGTDEPDLSKTSHNLLPNSISPMHSFTAAAGVIRPGCIWLSPAVASQPVDEEYQSLIPLNEN